MYHIFASFWKVSHVDKTAFMCTVVQNNSMHDILLLIIL